MMTDYKQIISKADYMLAQGKLGVYSPDEIEAHLRGMIAVLLCDPATAATICASQVFHRITVFKKEQEMSA